MNKLKFYDLLLWTVLISLFLFIISIYANSNSIFILGFLVIFIISQLIFSFSMYYFMFKTKNYILLIIGIVLWPSTIIFYLTIMRNKFKEGRQKKK